MKLASCVATAFLIAASMPIPLHAQKEMNSATKIADDFASYEIAVQRQAKKAIDEKRKDAIEALAKIRDDLIARKSPKIADRIQELIERCNKPTPLTNTERPKTISNGVSFSSAAHSIDLNRYSESYFIIEGSLVNTTDAIVSDVPVYLRRSRKGRPLPDYEWNSTIEVKGGMKPKETLWWSFSIPSGALASRDLPILSKEEVMEVSLDGSIWIPVPNAGRRDPYLMQLLNAPVK